MVEDMVRANVIVADPPYKFDDKLLQSSTKRGAESNYKSIMTDKDIINLDIPGICADDCVLVLWVPGSKLDVAIECCKKWGFKTTQTWVWVKTKQNPLEKLCKNVFKILKKEKKEDYKRLIFEKMNEFSLDETLNFFMGHCFRQTHELALVGVRGKYTKLLKNKSQRSVYIGPAKKKHSEKPEELQNRLETMFGEDAIYVELFARRERDGWICVGNEMPGGHFGEDIRDSIERIKQL
jgi:N6-adenosine-specific RNA methylase IME4